MSADEAGTKSTSENEERAGRRGLWRLGLTLGVVLGLAAAWAWSPLRAYVDLDMALAWADRWRQDPLAPLYLVTVFTLAASLAFPATLLMSLAGILLGPVSGFAAAMAGALLSASLVFAIGSRSGRKTIERFAGHRLHRLSTRIARRGVLAVAVLRIVPVAPFTVVNFAAGVSHIRFADFFWGTLLGMAPGTWAIVYFGDRLLALVQTPTLGDWALAAAAGGLVIGLGAAAAAWRRARRAARHQHTKNFGAASLMTAAALAPFLAAIAPLGEAVLFAVLGLFAIITLIRGAIHRTPLARPGEMSRPAVAFFYSLAAFSLWAGTSAFWAIDPGRSAEAAGRLALMAAAGLAIWLSWRQEAGSAPLRRGMLAGGAAALLVLAVDGLSDGILWRALHPGALAPASTIGGDPVPVNGLPEYGHDRGISLLVLLAWPLAIALWRRGAGLMPPMVLARDRIFAGAALLPLGAAGGAAALFGNVAAAAAFCLGLGAAALALKWPRGVAAVLAAGVVATGLGFPFAAGQLPPPADIMTPKGGAMGSIEHRQLIWNFTAARIAERPLAGWGMDSSRAIPGGTETVRENVSYLPLHPHNIFLQWWLELGLGGAALGVAMILCLIAAIARPITGAPVSPPGGIPPGGTPVVERGTKALLTGLLVTGLAMAMASYGIWQGWWQAGLWLSGLLAARASLGRP